MEKVLVIIDMQNDFIDGSLANSAAAAIVDKMVEYINNWDGDIYLSLDLHMDNYLSTREGQKLPIKHCIAGTEGAKINAKIAEAACKHKKGLFVIEKSEFGSFSWGDLERYTDIEICGVCTDICVVSNALIIRSMHPEANISLIEALCAGTTEEKHRAAVQVMESCNINIIK